MADDVPLSAGQTAVVLARAAECAERFDDMAQYMKQRIEAGGALHAEERDLFSAAYKGSLQQRRSAIRMVAAVEKHEASQGHETEASLAAGYRSKVEAELQSICAGVVTILQDVLVPKAEAGEPRAFYLKMQADYYRYAAEFTATGDAHEKAIKGASMTYAAATEEATHHLLSTHPVRLALALNYSVFQHEVLDDAAAATQTAEAALRSALRDLEGLPEEVFADVASTMQLLRDNLAMWQSSPQS